MEKKIAFSHRMKKGILDDDYTLFDNGKVLHEFDKHQYPGGQNYSNTLSANEVDDRVKDDFINSASPEDLKLVKKLIGR